MLMLVLVELLAAGALGTDQGGFGYQVVLFRLQSWQRDLRARIGVESIVFARLKAH